jgi:S1-C subfamily serine protease
VEVDQLGYSIVICDGAFTAQQRIRNCLVIARGAVHCRHGIYESLVITGDKVHLPARADSRVENSTIKEHEPNPLGLIKFFDPTRLGIKVEAAEGGLKVKQLQRESVFARAGLRTGDVLIGVAGAPIGDPERFRRTLRKLLAEGEEKVFRVRRADRVLEFTVVCAE